MSDHSRKNKIIGYFFILISFGIGLLCFYFTFQSDTAPTARVLYFISGLFLVLIGPLMEDSIRQQAGFVKQSVVSFGSVILICPVVLGGWILFFREQTPAEKSEEDAINANERLLNPIGPGDVVVLSYANNTSEWLAVDEEAFADLDQAKHNLSQLKRLRQAGKIYKVDSGTEATILVMKTCRVRSAGCSAVAFRIGVSG